MQQQHLLSILALGATAAVAGASAPAAAAASCDRSCLEKLVGQYGAALVRHDPADLPVTGDVRVAENSVIVKLGEGPSWKGITAFQSQPQYVADVTAQEVAYLGVVTDAGQPAFLAVRLKLRDGKISEIESILTHDGEGGPAFEPVGFIYREAPYIRDMPLKVRSSREGLMKVANTFWDVSTTSHDASKVPYAFDCWHFENGMNTNWERFFNADEQDTKTNPAYQPQGDGRIWTCARETYLTTKAWQAARQRHFVIDEERGLILSIANVDYPGRGMPSGPGGGAGPQGGAGGPPGGGAPGGAPGGGGPGGPGAANRAAIDGPGAAPLGMSAKGMGAAMSGQGYVTQHFMLMRVVDGKIAREQDLMHTLPTGATRPFD